MVNYQNLDRYKYPIPHTAFTSPLLARQEDRDSRNRFILLPHSIFYCYEIIAIFMVKIAILKIFFEKFPHHQFRYSTLGVTDWSQIVECDGYCCKDKADQKAVEDIRIICETSRLLNGRCMSYPGK